MSGDLSGLVARLEAVTTRLETVASRGGGGAGAEEYGEKVVAYDQFLSGAVAKVVSLANDIGGDLAEQIKLLHNGFKAQKEFLVLVSKHKTPSPDILQKLLAPTSQAVQNVQGFREKKRSSKQFNHLSAISEGVPVLGWVGVVKGATYVKETVDAAQFYLNRVIKDHKESAPKHVDWAKAVKAMFADLGQYIKDNYTAGLTWNPNGTPAPSTPAAPSAGGAPPPPSPPAVVPPAPAPAPSAGESDSASALFSQISNAGTGISTGLRKVTDNMKTHKNPSLRQTSVVPSKPKPAAKPTAHKPAVAAKKPPVFELQGGKKWIVDYQENNRSLVVNNGEMHQTIYMYMCKNSTLQVNGKVNSITLDGCKKCAVVFENVVATCEFINCQSVQCQVTGKVPTISIDKTDGCQVFLSKDSLAVDIVSAKSSEMNILLPNANGDMNEYALPEQYKTKWNGKTFVTVPTDSV